MAKSSKYISHGCEEEEHKVLELKNSIYLSKEGGLKIKMLNHPPKIDRGMIHPSMFKIKKPLGPKWNMIFKDDELEYIWKMFGPDKHNNAVLDKAVSVVMADTDRDGHETVLQLEYYKKRWGFYQSWWDEIVSPRGFTGHKVTIGIFIGPNTHKFYFSLIGLTNNK